MGIDKSLSDSYPSVIINGSRYHYGRDKASGDYLVEHETIALDRRAFAEKEDLQAFLINLPESAYPHWRFKRHPDWRAVSSEQRDAYAEQDRLLFRAMAAEKLEAGTAPSFNMDLEGEHGPYEPQRIGSRNTEPVIERVERQLQDWKTHNAWEGGRSEAGRLRVLEGEIDWSGVGGEDKEAVLARELDFGKIRREELNAVYDEIGSDDIDERSARRLFDEANYARAVAEAGRIPFSEQLRQARDTTRDLVESVMLDVWPRAGAVVDFGIASQGHYEALYYPIRNEEIAPAVLDAAMGNGARLTELARAAPSNPHKDIRFHTEWDDLLGRDGPAAERPDTSCYGCRLDEAARSAEGRPKDSSRGLDR